MYHWDVLVTYCWDVVGCFIWDLFETWRRTDITSLLHPLETSSRRSNKMPWRRTTETSLGVLFGTCLRHCGDVLIGRRCYVLFRRCHDVPIRRCGDVPLRHLVDVPLRRHWVFHLGSTCDVAGMYGETLWRPRHDFLLPGGVAV